jgi:hypothetical protein
METHLLPLQPSKNFPSKTKEHKEWFCHPFLENLNISKQNLKGLLKLLHTSFLLLLELAMSPIVHMNRGPTQNKNQPNPKVAYEM